MAIKPSPKQQPIGQNADGTFIYTPVAPVPKKTVIPVTSQSTGIPNVGIPWVKGLTTPIAPSMSSNMPPVTFSADVAKTINAPVKDTFWFSQKIDYTSPRVISLKRHFDYLQERGELALNDKQSDYIKRFKTKFPSYETMSDPILYGKVILENPKTMEKYGNIGDKSAIKRFRDLTVGSVVDIWEAVMEGIDDYQDYQNAYKWTGLEGITTTSKAIASGVGRTVWDALTGVASNIINTRPAFGMGNVTSDTERLGNIVEDIASPILWWSKDWIDWLKWEGWTDGQLQNLSTVMENDPIARANAEAAMNILNLIPGWILSRTNVAMSAKKVLKDTAEKLIKKSLPLWEWLFTAGKNTKEWIQTLAPDQRKLQEWYILQNINDWASPTKEIRRGNKTLDKIVSKQEAKDISSPQVLSDLWIQHDSHIEDWKYNTIDTANEIKNGAIKLSTDTLKPVLKDLDVQAPRFSSLDKMRDEAIVVAKKWNPKDLADVIEDIRKAFDDFREGGIREQFPDGFDRVGLHENKIKFSQWVYDPIRPTKNTAGRFISDVLRKELEGVVPESIVPIKAFNGELEKMFAASRYLEELHAKPVSKTFLKRMADKAAKTAGTVVWGAVGSIFWWAGTVPWAMAGYQTTSMLQRIADNLSNPLKKYFLDRVESKIPSSITKVWEFQKWIDIQGHPSIPLLEAPKFNSRSNTWRIPQDTVLPGGEKGYLWEIPSKNINTQRDINSTSIENNNTDLSDFASPSEVIPVVSWPGQSLAVSVENKVFDYKKALSEFQKLSPEEKVKAKQSSPLLSELVEANTRIQDIQEFKGDFWYVDEIMTSHLAKNYMYYSPETKKMIQKSLDKEEMAVIQKTNRKLAGLPDPVEEVALPKAWAKTSEVVSTPEPEIPMSKEEKMLMKELMGIDMDKVNYVDEYIAKKLWKDRFHYNEQDLGGRYDPEIEWWKKEADELYDKSISTPPEPVKDTPKVPEDESQSKAKIYKNKEQARASANMAQSRIDSIEKSLENSSGSIKRQLGLDLKYEKWVLDWAKKEYLYAKKDIAGKKYDQTEIYEDYKENYMHWDKWKGKSKAIIIDSDSIKKMFQEYDPKNPGLVHEESSQLSKEFFDRAVKENPDSPVIFTAGWPASGKTEGIVNQYHGDQNIIFDTVLADLPGFLRKAKSKIDSWNVKVHAIYTHIEQAKIYNAWRDRSVPIPLLIEKHKGFRNAMAELIESEEYKSGKILLEIRKNTEGKVTDISPKKNHLFIRDHKNRLDIL